MVGALVIFSSKENKQGHKLDLTPLYACWVMQMMYTIWHKRNAKGSPCIPRAPPPYVLCMSVSHPMDGALLHVCYLVVYPFIPRVFARCVRSAFPVLSLVLGPSAVSH